MNNVKFSPESWEEFLMLQESDKIRFKRVKILIKDTMRNGYGGIGHPEPLKGDLSGFWSKEIDDKNRFVFRIADNTIEILQCDGHYSDQ